MPFSLCAGPTWPCRSYRCPTSSAGQSPPDSPCSIRLSDAMEKKEKREKLISILKYILYINYTLSGKRLKCRHICVCVVGVSVAWLVCGHQLQSVSILRFSRRAAINVCVCVENVTRKLSPWAFSQIDLDSSPISSDDEKYTPSNNKAYLCLERSWISYGRI